MNRRYIATLVAVFSCRRRPAAAAQDRFSLTSPNGISFSEFKGYEAWR